jgi:bacterioferritin (cytochrome b1)
MLDEILKAEEGHRDYIEAQLEQQMGLQTYLAEGVD